MKTIKKIVGSVAIGGFLLVGMPIQAHAQTPITTTNCVTLTQNIGVTARDRATGGQVSILQAYLNSAGYMKYPVTGYFGTITLAAVKQLQVANNIISTGYVGPLTRAKIQNITCTSATAQAPIITAMTPTSSPVGTTVVLTGSGFTANSSIKFGFGAIHPIFYDEHTISFVIPENMGLYCAPGMMCSMIARQVTQGIYPVSVINTLGVLSNALDFTVTVPQT